MISYPNEFNDLAFQRTHLFSLIASFPLPAQAIIKKALEVAHASHANQLRDEGTPYIIHCIRVAIILYEILGIRDVDSLSAGLLHDTLEDTALPEKEIMYEFGERVLYLVKSVTRNQDGETEENRYERKRKKFLETLTKEDAVRAIKTSDWLDNMRSWYVVPKEKLSETRRKRWLLEAETLYIPLAETVSQAVTLEMKGILSDHTKDATVL